MGYPIIKQIKTPEGLYDINAWHSDTADLATKANQDGNGKTISDTYETKSDAQNKLDESKTYTDNAIASIPSVFIFEINGSDTAGYTSNKTFTEINDAYVSGKTLECIYSGMHFQLNSTFPNSAYLFVNSGNNGHIMFTFFKNGTIRRTDTNYLSRITALENNVEGLSMNKADLSVVESTYETKTDASTKLTEAKNYTNTEISKLINSAPTTLDTLGEIATAMSEHEDVVKALNDAIGTKVPNTRTVNGKALSADITLSASDVGAADSSHTHPSYVNQNAFSNVKVGSTTVAADTATDTLEIAAGTGISVAGDATNDKVTITNSGVRSISTGSTNGTISVNTNGASADVAVKGLGSAAYTNSGAYAPASHSHDDKYYTESEIDNKLKSKLNKLTYEWNKEYNAGGTAGYLLIGSFPMYDTNVTIDIDATTSTTYHGTVVIATQNVSETSIGSSHTITVYGDPTGVISSAIRVVWTSGSRNYNVYFVPSTWSKNLIHIRAMGNYLENIDESKICTQFTTGTAPATTSGLTVVNALTSAFNNYTHPNTHPASMITGLATVATSGSYNDLSNKPTIPSVGNGTVTIKQNGTSKGSFTLNQTGNATIELTNTTYSAGTGISLSGTTFSNSGVRSIATGTTNGTISVNTNGTSANVAVKGLGSAAYTNTTAYDPAGAAADAYESAQVYVLTQIEAAIDGDVKTLDKETLANAKSYTDTKVASYLPLSGGTITGAVTFNASPITKANAFYNSYDTSSGSAVCLIGTVGGNIQIGSKISGQSSSNKNVVVASEHILRPASNASQSLGTSSYYWGTAYVNKLYIKDPGTTTNSTTTSDTYPMLKWKADGGAVCRYKASSSSRRYKTDIIEGFTDEKLNPENLYNVKLYQYKYKDDHLEKDDQRVGMDLYGFIVEDLVEHYPSAVDLNSKGEPDDWNKTFLIPAMLKLIQDQKKDIDILKEENQNLKFRLEKIENILNL